MAALALGVFAGQARAAEPATLRSFLFGAPAPPDTALAVPSVAHYSSEGGEDFVLDRSVGGEAVLKFDDGSEILALSANPGPRGDVIYKDDTGQPVLRATRLGGLTLFTPSNPQGAPAASLGAASRPRPPAVLGPEALWQVLVQASARASRAAQHLVWFDAGDVSITPSTEAVFADAFVLTADAFTRVGGEKLGQGIVSRLVTVRFVQGPNANAQVIGRAIQITLAPQRGVAGRPSSRRIAAAMERR